MSRSKLSVLLIIGLVLSFGTSAQSNCGKKKKNEENVPANSNKTQITNTDKMVEEPVQGGEIKVLAEGSFGKMEEPFLFVARDAETYAKLKDLLGNLPASEVDFKRQAVVAAFAGTKPTGGFSVEIKKTGDKISVAVSEPPPGAIVTQALTMPFKVAAVPVQEDNSLNLEVSDDWKKAGQTYRLTSGLFESSGGIAGNLKSFAVEGSIDVYRFNDLVTFVFNLSGTGADKNRKMTETASGVLSGEKIDLTRVDAGSFSEGPKPPVKVSGTMTSDKLLLTFESLPAKAADGFQVSGKLEAVKGN